MAVKIRMSRMGRRHRPFFRINVIDSRTPRDGRVLEKLGHYDPLEKEAEKQLVLNTERALHWLSLGAVPSDTVSDMLVKLGVKHKYAEERARKGERARAIAKTPAGKARSTLGTLYKQLTRDEMLELGETIVESVRVRAPADSMFAKGIIKAGSELLIKHSIAEGIHLAKDSNQVNYLKNYAGAILTDDQSVAIMEWLGEEGLVQGHKTSAVVDAMNDRAVSNGHIVTDFEFKSVLDV